MMTCPTPILFSGEMVRALIAGRKTTTRRLLYTERKSTRMTGKPLKDYPEPPARAGTYWGTTKWHTVKPGWLLWVRERTMCVAVRDGEIKVRYLADGHEPDRWLPFPDRLTFKPRAGACLSMGCFKEASRITCPVANVKIERLHAISPTDAIAEGWPGPQTDEQRALPQEVHNDAAIDWYSDLWVTLHGVESWNSNPWVTALTFAVQMKNFAD